MIIDAHRKTGAKMDGSDEQLLCCLSCIIPYRQKSQQLLLIGFCALLLKTETCK